MKYIKIISNKDNDLITQLNDARFANYRVIAILKAGLDDVAYLELDKDDEIITAIEPKLKGKK